MEAVISRLGDGGALAVVVAGAEWSVYVAAVEKTKKAEEAVVEEVEEAVAAAEKVEKAVFQDSPHCSVNAQ